MKLKLKKFLALFLSVLFIVAGTFSVFGEEDDEENEVDRSTYIPEIVLTNGPIFDVQVGKENEIDIELRNIADYGAYNVIVQPEPTSGDNNPFTITFADERNVVPVMGGKMKRSFHITVTPDPSAENKTYPLKLKYIYYNGFGVKFTGEDTIYLKLGGSQNTPRFQIMNFKVDPTSLEPGGIGKVSASIKNTGNIQMNDVEIQITGLSSETISLYNSISSVKVGRLGINAVYDFSFPIAANENLESGNYPVTFKILYKNDQNVALDPIEQQFFVNVGGSGSNGKPDLEIINMKEPSGTYGVNQNFNISFDLTNHGDRTAENIRITAKAADGVVPKSTSVKTLRTLEPGKSTPFTYTFAATASSKSQNYSIEFAVEYEDGTKKDGANNIVTFSQFAGVNVSNPDNDEDGDEKESKPKIIVSEYTCDPLIVQAGEEFDLSMTFLNTHAVKSVKNVKMFLTLAEETSSDTEKTGNIFTPVDSSNTFYFDSIAPKSTAVKQLRLYVVPDAQPKTYTLTVNFEYEDDEKNEYTATELLGINVKQSTKVETGDIFVPETAEAGMPITVSFDFYNTGKVTVNNFMIRMEGQNVDPAKASTYYGNIESGNQDYFETTFTPLSEGDANVDIILSYDDPDGEHKEIKNSYQLTVLPMPSMDDMSDMPMEPEPVNPLVKYGKIAGIVIAVLAVLFIAGMIIRKKIKAKKEHAFLIQEENDSEELEQDDEDKN
ncbi:MAG: hypothetical protein KHZ62_07875 [Clostridiales bacterium]|nr:hypothetical protein [Clostridiales bacterium]